MEYIPSPCQWYCSEPNCKLDRECNDDCPDNCHEYLPVLSRELNNEFVHAILAVINDIGWETSTLEISIELAIKYPELVKKMVGKGNE